MYIAKDIYVHSKSQWCFKKKKKAINQVFNFLDNIVLPLAVPNV